MPLTRRALLAAAGQAAVAWPAFGQSGGARPGLPLRRIAKMRGLVYGSSIDAWRFAQDRPYEALSARECGLFACTRAHWDQLEPSQGQFRYAAVDEDYAWAAGHGMEFLTQGLVWHERVPAWFAALDGRDAAVRAVRDFATKACRHFAGRVYAWIVVNESIWPNDGRADGLRNSVFIQKIGPDYIDLTFRAAREGDPKARLVYNDFDLELDIDFHEVRRKALLRLLDDLKKRGTPVDVIGLQSHLRTSLFPRHFNERVFNAFLDQLAARGFEIQISELDVIDQGAPADIAERDAEIADIYSRYLNAALAHPAVKSVVTWGLTDRYTWIGNEFSPQTRRADGLPTRPLPFDADLRPKPAYFAIAKALAAAPVR